MKGFSFKGQEALDWIHRVGKVVGYEATFEEDGSVKPVSFDMQNLVSYLPVESKAPDEAEYQSPVCNLSECRFMDIDFFRGTIMIHRNALEECDGKVSVLFQEGYVSFSPGRRFCSRLDVDDWLYYGKERTRRGTVQYGLFH